MNAGKALWGFEKCLHFLLSVGSKNVALLIEIEISVKWFCLYLVQYMLHQIKAKLFYTSVS